MAKSRLFGFSFSTADCHSIYQCWHQDATSLPCWIQCRIVKKCLWVDLAIGLLRKLTVVDLAETEQQDKASRASEPERGRLWTKRGKSWTVSYSMTGADFQ